MMGDPPGAAAAIRGAAVALRHVHVVYDSAEGAPVGAVRDVSLDVEAGSIVALLGPSGCGKTSLLRAIAGLERPTIGEITIGDTVVSRDRSDGRRTWVHPERRNVGMVFQDGALFPHLSVADNIAFGLRLPRAQRTRRVADLLDLVDLVGYAERMPGTLSGGQQQRVALARSLAPQPGVLLLDEPFSALDTALRVQVRSEVARILRNVGVTTIFVTHDQDEAFVLGDRVAVMNDGEVMQYGTPNELYRHPTSPFVAQFVGEANFVPGRLTDRPSPVDMPVGSEGEFGDVVVTPLGPIPVADHRAQRLLPDVAVLVRPEQVGVMPVDDESTGEGSLAVVDTVEYYGHDVRYELILENGQRLAARTKSTELYERGDRVRLRFRSRARNVRAVAFSLDAQVVPPAE